MGIAKIDIIRLEYLFSSNRGEHLMKYSKGIRLFLILFQVLFTCAGCVPDQYEPEEGVWVCEELQIQLSYEQNTPCFVVKNGEKIICACGSDRGVQYIYVSCQEKDHPVYDLGEEIFSAKIVSLSETELVVYDEQDKQQYIFIRQD